MDNIILTTDSYKVSHHKMLPQGTTRMVGNWTPRSLKYAPKGVKKITSFEVSITSSPTSMIYWPSASMNKKTIGSSGGMQAF